MTTSAITAQEIRSVTSSLIRSGITDATTYPSITSNNGVVSIGFQGDRELAIALRNIPYDELYTEIAARRMYNVKLADGAFLQLSYRFDQQTGSLVSHRLGFFPCPDLLAYQNDPDIYEEEPIFAEVVRRSLVVFPIRFDYSSDEGAFEAITHPRSHLTLGQYTNCRIPVCSPITPHTFVSFIVRNFYNTAYRDIASELVAGGDLFAQTIDAVESQIPHMRLSN